MRKNIIYLLIKHFVKYKRYQLLTNTNCVELELENAELACCFMACAEGGGMSEASLTRAGVAHLYRRRSAHNKI